MIKSRIKYLLYSTNKLSIERFIKLLLSLHNGRRISRDTGKEIDWRRKRWKFNWILFVLILLQEINATLSGMLPIKSTRIVETRYGKLQGMIYPMDHVKHLKPVEVFLGVPYATPPVRSNRFSPTRTPSPWEGVRMADKMGPVCPQKLPGMSTPPFSPNNDNALSKTDNNNKFLIIRYKK